MQDSEKSTKAQPAADPSPPKPVGNKDKAKLVAFALAYTLDGAVKRVNKLVSTTDGQERFIASIGYGSSALHYLVSPAFFALLTRLRTFIGRSRPISAKTTERAERATPHLLALSSLISETRTTLRLLGLFPLLTWGSHTLAHPPKDRITRFIAFGEILSCILYQGTENIAWLSTKNIVPPSFINRYGGISRWYVWSVRYWLAYILLELFRLGREIVTLRSSQPVSKEEEQGRKEAWGAVKKGLVNNLSWLPLCIHWSVEKGVGFPVQLVGLFSFSAGAWGLKDAWAGTA